MDLADFRALARSAPWRWRAVQLTVVWRGGRGPDGPLPMVEGAPVRAWVQGRHGLRVEDLQTGAVLLYEWLPSPGGWRGSGRAGAALARRAGRPVLVEAGEHLVGVDDFGVDDQRAPQPVLRADGLVASRPPRGSGPDDGLSYDGALWQTYRWVAMLDPVELADGSETFPDGRGEPDPSCPPVRLVTLGEHEAGRPSSVELVDHGGRLAWEAMLAPTAGYHPRCSCCPLLPGLVASRLLQSEGGLSEAQLDPPAGGWPSAHRVRLDAASGVVVELEQLDGHGAGEGWTATIEAVDVLHPLSWFAAG